LGWEGPIGHFFVPRPPACGRFFTTKRLFYEAAFAYAYLRGLLMYSLAGENSTNWLVLDLWLYILLNMVF
jgi:hypothetical protein